LDEVKSGILALDCCEIHAADDVGRIIIVIEGATTEEESQKLKLVQAVEHVLSAEMVYAYSESEFSPEDGKFERVPSEILDRLNTDIPADKIVYNGHLNDK
jgi:nitrate reductase NapD